jgi:hypothetical protein
MVVGGRTFFESIPSNILTMILIGASLYLIGVIFYLWKKYRYNHAIWHCTRSRCCLSLRLSYWRSRLSDYTMGSIIKQLTLRLELLCRG